MDERDLLKRKYPKFSTYSMQQYKVKKNRCQIGLRLAVRITLSVRTPCVIKHRENATEGYFQMKRE